MNYLYLIGIFDPIYLESLLGILNLCYGVWYGFGRMFIEGLRTDSLYVGPFRISQVVGGLCFLVGTGLIVYMLVRVKQQKVKGEYTPVFANLTQGDGEASPEQPDVEVTGDDTTENNIEENQLEDKDDGKID